MEQTKIRDCTSLQNIIVGNHTKLEQPDLGRLFGKKEYPKFEVKQFNTGSLIGKQRFDYFVKVLQGWNLKIDKGDEIRQNQYYRNDFIFSSLKSISVQSGTHIEQSLQRLYDWYCTNHQNTPVYNIRQKNPLREEMEEWRIRTSYKSNLPNEIDNYKRRHLFERKDHNKQNDQKSKIEVNTFNDGFYRRENNYLRVIRENKQVEQLQTTWKKDRMRFCQNMPKQYYKNEFEEGKTIIHKPLKHQQRFYSSEGLKDYRVKTTMGFRPYGWGNSSRLNSSQVFLRTSNSRKWLPENCVKGQQMSRSVLTNIDGLNLISNPFDKLKKKKKK